jgi:hypothetical protein
LQDIEETEERGEIYKVLFLCFPFISKWFSYNFVKSQYNDLLKKFNIKDDYAFEKAHIEFQDKLQSGNYVRFSHPSYSEALSFILPYENGIFSTVLIKLADNKGAAMAVAYAVSNNFDKLPENVRNELLIKLADNKDAAGSVARAVANNFDKLPLNVQNLLFKLADNKDAAVDIAGVLNN